MPLNRLHSIDICIIESNNDDSDDDDAGDVDVDERYDDVYDVDDCHYDNDDHNK